ncbi:pantetheine-phosphate adenylyltransferase [Candidatus Gottesmanbacteria bacterium]|nr:pantetheine-phosphate adenylyltransferase [Candidatus Gottesmanbacteria bacterium]
MYHHLFVAGTFDGLHAGHTSLLSVAFARGQRVTIGLTTDMFVQKFKIFNSQFSISENSTNENSLKIRNYKLKIRMYEKRKKELTRWLKKQSFLVRAVIIPISDPYEPAASMVNLDALIVTTENRKTGERINELRQGLSLSPLTLIEVPMVAAQDGAPISSTRLRNGEIDHDGRLVMPESLRSVLGKPLGKVLSGKAIDGSIRRNKDKLIITVGDVATKTLLDAGVTPALAIIDGKVGRRPFHEALKILQLQKVKPFSLKPVKSGPGYISREAMEAIERFFASYVLRPTSYVLFIDGEEDLLVLPVIMHAPSGSVVYYGQPNQGLVEVIVNGIQKNQVKTLLREFELGSK